MWRYQKMKGFHQAHIFLIAGKWPLNQPRAVSELLYWVFDLQS